MIRSVTIGDNGQTIRWGIAGHVDDNVAIAEVRAFENNPTLDLRVPGHIYERLQDVQPDPDEVWVESCKVDDPGASPVTTVVPADSDAGRMWDAHIRLHSGILP